VAHDILTFNLIIFLHRSIPILLSTHLFMYDIDCPGGQLKPRGWS